MARVILVGLLVLPFAALAAEAAPGDGAPRRLLEAGLRSLGAMDLLEELCRRAPHRLAGSAGGRAAEALALEWMERFQLQEVRTEGFSVRRWERGAVERVLLELPGAAAPEELAACALGGSVGTPDGPVRGRGVELRSLQEAASRAPELQGRIVFFNRPMDPALPSTFEAYGGAADQRVHGASASAAQGAVAVLVRSLTLKADDEPHTGILIYREGTPAIPALALGARSADRLSEALAAYPDLLLSVESSARELAPVDAVNTLGQLTGTERPDEIVVLGCHLDAWDKGCGAHDDAAGCAQVVEALRLLRDLGEPPRRSIRGVLYMDEEMGGTGGRAYAGNPSRQRETHRYAIESDRGGFLPVGFSVDAEDPEVLRLRGELLPLLEPLGIRRVERGGGGVDIGPLRELGCTCLGLVPDSQRYFDVHHANSDVPAAVHPRELELGAVALAVVARHLANRED
ncbi:MAG: M20/M25/M40 family metallo-hydrolase [Deltaproteobacteria bacterium]|nr:M20/M25/M40 family metallo-hydrolase [Deltaproteobacteria bacterium]